MAGRRGNGEGSIYQRKDGSWCATVSDGFSPATGKPIRRYAYAKTRKEAQEKLLAFQKAASENLPPTRKDVTIETLIAEYLEYKRPAWRPKTDVVATSICQRLIVDKLGKLRLIDLDARRIMAWLRELGATRSAQIARGHLRSACELALRWEWITRNPVLLTDPPKVVVKRPKELSREDIRTILSAARTPPERDHYADYWPIVALMIGSGLRISECLGLRISEWNPGKREISVSGQLSRVSGGNGGAYAHTPPKTKAGVRVLVLPGFAASALQERLATQEKHKAAAGEKWNNELGLIFTSAEGLPLSDRNVRTGVMRVLKRGGIEGVGLHHLRHAHASLLLDEGIPVPVVAAVMGHANPGITMTIYAHKFKGTHGQVAAALEGLDLDPASTKEETPG